MAHRTLKNSYANLSERLNRFPQGAPSSDLLFEILKILFSEREAELVSRLPIKPFSAEKASRIWKMDLAAAQNVIDELAGRAILVALAGYSLLRMDCNDWIGVSTGWTIKPGNPHSAPQAGKALIIPG